MRTPDHQRRLHPRIDLSLEVFYGLTQESLAEEAKHAELFDLSPTGLRIEIEDDVSVGETLFIRILGADDEEFDTQAEVSWSRPRQIPSGKRVFDVGLRFEKNLLAQHRGPLANALAHLLAIQDVEPARNFARIDVSLKAESLDSPELQLRLADISPGGMRFVVEGQLSSGLEMGSRLAIFIHREAQETMILAKVAWMAGKNELGSVSSPQVQDSFGVDFLALSDDAAEVVESIMESRFQPERMVLAFQPPSEA